MSQTNPEVIRLHAILKERNKQLDAMAWVWCSGGCVGGVYRFTDRVLTEEIVELAEHNVKRLRTAYNNEAFHEHRLVTVQPSKFERVMNWLTFITPVRLMGKRYRLDLNDWKTKLITDGLTVATYGPLFTIGVITLYRFFSAM